MWFSMKRQHAIIVMADSLYYTKFKHHCSFCDVSHSTSFRRNDHSLMRRTRSVVVIAKPSKPRFGEEDQLGLRGI
ncbi:hypothetical protein RIF29_15857 [Crotalaria pallida]|uniref:Uncharacterized protein n=1 Tax=Crotalaria pallida TaxID=3830 RepID=A0AAN9FFM9_CROPI